MGEDNSQQPTKFNMGLATLESMHKLLKFATGCSLDGDLIGWFEALRALRREIAPFIKDTEFDEIENKFKDINSIKWLMKGNNKLKIIPMQIGRIDNCLNDLDIYMRRAMKEAGMLMPKSDDPRFALEG